ncbi:uncharacterized Zn finger protein (UPF0148 family) [Streptacidiphilus sp. MAP12-33]|uniref:hypothetical protein n=1 Tax=Streptacidiphilus sp. MAP12-33 TaxID=3156266 RepID=UPI003517358F
MDDLCSSCGTDLNETDGNTFDMGDGITVQLCPDCEARWAADTDEDEEDES